jgi:hypothetical protein
MYIVSNLTFLGRLAVASDEFDDLNRHPDGEPSIMGTGFDVKGDVAVKARE